MALAMNGFDMMVTRRDASISGTLAEEAGVSGPFFGSG
jgi:hypothetical protein